MECRHDAEKDVLETIEIEIGKGPPEGRAVVVDVRESGGDLCGHPLRLLVVGQGPGNDQAQDEDASGQHACEQRTDADELERERRDADLGRGDAKHDEARLADHPPAEQPGTQYPYLAFHGCESCHPSMWPVNAGEVLIGRSPLERAILAPELSRPQVDEPEQAGWKSADEHTRRGVAVAPPLTW